MKKHLAFLVVFALAVLNFSHLAAQSQPSKSKKNAHKTIKAKETAKKDTVVAPKDTEPVLEDTVKVTFGKNIVNLRTFDGWILDDSGKWISSPNRIPYRNADYNNELYTKYKLGNDNISQINVIEIKIDNVPYLGILIEQCKESFKTHADSEFRCYTGADYYLIKKDDYAKLWKDGMKMGKPYEADIKVAYAGLVGYKNIKKRPEYMSSEINKDLRNRIYTDTSVKTYLQFGFLPVKTKKGSFMRFYYGLEYAHEGEAVAPFDFKVFKEKYYEVSLDLFHKFARPQSLVFAKPKPANPVKKPVSKTTKTQTPITSPAKPPVAKKPVKPDDDF